MLDCELESKGSTFTVRALVDTGAEVNVIRSGVIPEGDLITLEHPWRLTAANQQTIVGGDREARVVLRLTGVEVDTKKQCGLKIPTTFLVADLGKVDAILSYNWLSDAHLIVNPSRHGIFLTDHEGRGMIWVAGFKGETETTRLTNNQDSLPVEEEDPQESGIGAIPAKKCLPAIAEVGEGECTMALPLGGSILLGMTPHPPHSSIADHDTSSPQGFSNQGKTPALPEEKVHSSPFPECPSPGVPGQAGRANLTTQLDTDLASLKTFPASWESWVGILG